MFYYYVIIDYDLIMMLLRARNNNIQSFAYIIIKHATFIYAINSIRKLVRLAQVVEQWTGNPEVGGSSPPSNHLIFGCLRNSF